MSIINDLLEKTPSFKEGNSYESRRNSFDAYKADIAVKYCIKCNRCWEFDRTAIRNLKGKKRGNDVISHYINFPTYGKSRETCPHCKGNKNGNNRK